MGPGAGGSRVVKSESGRLLRQWWNEPGDYTWVVEFPGPPGRRQDEIRFRPMQLDASVLATDPLLSTDGP
jgi:hypothetical protein